MQPIDAPVYEVKQDSEWYQTRIKRKSQTKEFFNKVNSKYFKDSGFVFYHSEYFGVQGDSADYETYKEELLKNPNKDGVYIFKKRSHYYKILNELLEKIEKESPFKVHDVFGLNNVSYSQWIKRRWFFSVKNENLIKDVKHKEIAPVNYKEYLQLVMDSLE